MGWWRRPGSAPGPGTGCPGAACWLHLHPMHPYNPEPLSWLQFSCLAEVPATLLRLSSQKLGRFGRLCRFPRCYPPHLKSHRNRLIGADGLSRRAERRLVVTSLARDALLLCLGQATRQIAGVLLRRGRRGRGIGGAVLARPRACDCSAPWSEFEPASDTFARPVLMVWIVFACPAYKDCRRRTLPIGCCSCQWRFPSSPGPTARCQSR